MSSKSGSGSFGYTERAASALKSGTAAAAAAGFTVGSTIAYVAPHMAGAIDVIVVQQPDGSRKSSPFYVRFGKYSHLRVQNKDVQISVNDTKMDFVMHLGRTGEAYFVEETGDHEQSCTRDGRADEDYLGGGTSPLSGYSSGEDAPFQRFSRSESGTSPEFSAFGDRLQALKRHDKLGETHLVEDGALHGSHERAGSASSGPPESSGVLLRTSGSAPPSTYEVHSLETSFRPGKAFSQPIPFADASAATSFPGGVPEASDRHGRCQGSGELAVLARDMSSERPGLIVPSESALTRVLKGFEMSKGVPRPAKEEPYSESPGMITVSSLSAGLADAAALQSPPGPSRFQVLDAESAEKVSPAGSETQDFGEEAGECSVAIEKDNLLILDSKVNQGLSSHVLDLHAADVEEDFTPEQIAHTANSAQCVEDDDDSVSCSPRPSSWDTLKESDTESGSFSFSSQGLSPRSPPRSPRTFHPSSSLPPVHPWSAARPRHLPTPLSSQPVPTTISASDAAAPVKGPRDDSKTTAIRPEPFQQGEGMAMFGNRIELELEDEKILQGEAAPYAMHEAHVDRKKWENGSCTTANMDPVFAAIAMQQDAEADEAGSQCSQLAEVPVTEGGQLTTSYMDVAFQELCESSSWQFEADRGPLSSMTSTGLDMQSNGMHAGVQNLGLSTSANVGYDGSSLAGVRSEEPVPLQDPNFTPLEPLTGQEGGTGSQTMFSPTDKGYLGDSEPSDQQGDGILVKKPAGKPKSDLDKPWSALNGFALSLCGDKLRQDMSPEEAAEVFEANLVRSEEFAATAPQMLSSTDLVCRVGGLLYPWRTAAPLVLGTLAFGGSWENLLPDGSAGIRVPTPAGLFGEDKATERKAPRLGDLTLAQRSSWRLWLGSWRTVSGLSASNWKEDGPKLRTASMVPRSSSLTDLLSFTEKKPAKRRAFVPTPGQLASLPLELGQNTIDFTFGRTRLRAYVYFFRWSSRLIISDVDGTITRSDILGHVLPRVGLDWSHFGINRLFTNIRANGYEIMFLSSRAIAQASATRDYLHTLNQGGETLPPGPVIISPDGLFPSLYRELVLRRPHEFKIRALEDIKALFPSDWNPFYAGFGNRDTDEISYLTVGIPASKIFIINPRGELRKASSSVDTSTWSTLKGINDLVHQVFPPLHIRAGEDIQEREEFNDYNFWHKAPAIIIESDDELFEDGIPGESELSSDEYASAEEYMGAEG
eukprot:jgi/Botrbrau1/9289/Bobra.0111s0014.1